MGLRHEKVEILVLDDGSSRVFELASIADLPLVNYERLVRNMGRSIVRNMLLEKACGRYILFLDADMLPDHDDFLRRYLDLAAAGRDIVCGGISYRQYIAGDGDSLFHLYKSNKTEALPARIRNRSPWRYLFTSNIMLRREVVTKVRFDKRFTGYGYEDIEWGIRLSGLYTIVHIDNTCTHMGVMGKMKVLENMKKSIDNLALLHGLHPAKTASGGAVFYARKLLFMPDAILATAEGFLTRLFTYFSSPPLLFVLFQCDKVVLLARALKRG